MKAVLTLAVSIMLAQFAQAEQSLSEILTQAHCKPQHLGSSQQIETYNCTNLKSDTFQMMGLQKTAVILSGQDEFETFENDSTDLSHVHDTPEIEIE